MRIFSMFNPRSLINLVFICNVYDWLQIKFWAWCEVGVRFFFFFIFIDTSSWCSTIYWEDHRFSTDVQRHPYILRHRFSVGMFLESLSYSVGLFWYQYYTLLITISWEQFWLFCRECILTLLFVINGDPRSSLCSSRPNEVVNIPLILKWWSNAYYNYVTLPVSHRMSESPLESSR